MPRADAVSGELLVTPMRGVIPGGGEQELAVHVTVTPLPFAADGLT
jgi:hypothetical protein